MLRAEWHVQVGLEILVLGAIPECLPVSRCHALQVSLHVLVLQPSATAVANVVRAHERAGHALPVAVSCSAVGRPPNSASRVLRSLICPRPRKVSILQRPHHVARGDLRRLDGLEMAVSYKNVYRGSFFLTKC